MSESYEDKFKELKKSISNFTEIDVDKPLGEKIRSKLGNSYNIFLQEEINSISDNIHNVPLKNILKSNISENKDYKNFQSYYEKFVTKTREDIDFDFDKFEELLEHYEHNILRISEDINNLEEEIIVFFKNIDQIKEWVSNIPNNIKIDTEPVEEQIEELVNDSNIKDKIKEYKELKLKYFFFKQYFFIKKFISLAEENDINCNDNEYTYRNDLESELNVEDEIVKTSPSLLKSVLDFFF